MIFLCNVVTIFCYTCSPDACGWWWISAVHCFMPLSKESVDDLSLLICYSSFNLVHTGIPVFGLWKELAVVGKLSDSRQEIAETIMCPLAISRCCCVLLSLACVAGLEVFNEPGWYIMTFDMSWLDILHSFRRSFKWAHAKAINLLCLVKAPYITHFKTAVALLGMRGTTSV